MATYSFYTYKIDLKPGSYASGVPSLPGTGGTTPEALSIQTETISYTMEANGAINSHSLKYAVTSSNGPTQMDEVTLNTSTAPYQALGVSDGASTGDMDIFMGSVIWMDAGVTKTSTVMIFSKFAAQDMYIAVLDGDPISSFFTTPTRFDLWYNSITGFSPAGGDYAAGEIIDPLTTDNLTMTDDDVLHGTSGDDGLAASIGDDTLYGYEGSDRLSGGAGDDILYGGKDGDSLSGGTGNNTLYGGQSRLDFANYSDHDTAVTVQLAFGRGLTGTGSGTNTSDILHNIEGAFGSEFNDTLFGAHNDNFLHGFGGDDLIRGGAGDDTLYGHSGEDTLNGQAGDDAIHGGDDRDILKGGNGNDYITGGSGEDTISGGADSDQIFGNAGADIIDGDDGDDIIEGGNGADFLEGSEGADDIKGNKGADTLKGQRGEDTLLGGNGHDILNGGRDNDEMTGGDGSDIFIFEKFSDVNRDTVTDFTSGDDLIDITDFGLSTSELSDIIQLAIFSSSGVSLNFATDQYLTLDGISEGDIGLSDFLI